MKFRAALFALLVTSVCASAQHLDFGLGFGVKGGWAPTNVAQGTAIFGGSNQYVIGPVAEVRVPFGFAAEVDGLYHHADYGTALGNYSAWEVPYMAKFRFPIPLIKPFIYAGGAWRQATSNIQLSSNGFTAGIGLELRIAKLRLSAEGRYLRWGSDPYSKRDQAEVLFGLIF
jgi:hypothetical protein